MTLRDKNPSMVFTPGAYSMWSWDGDEKGLDFKRARHLSQVAYTLNGLSDYAENDAEAEAKNRAQQTSLFQKHGFGLNEIYQYRYNDEVPLELRCVAIWRGRSSHKYLWFGSDGLLYTSYATETLSILQHGIIERGTVRAVFGFVKNGSDVSIQWRRDLNPGEEVRGLLSPYGYVQPADDLLQDFKGNYTSTPPEEDKKLISERLKAEKLAAGS